MGRCQVRFERLSALPHLIDREMVRMTVLLQDLEADHARVLLTVRGEFLDKGCGLRQDVAPARDIDVRYRV